MDVRQLSEQNGAFYVPAFVVKVDDKSLVHELGIGVSQVEVDRTLGAAGRFSFTVVETFDVKDRIFVSAFGRPVLEALRFGTQIEICVGYGDHKRLPAMIKGVVTEVSTSFSESGSPELLVAGYDNLFPLTLGKRSRSWVNVSDSDVVQLIAGGHNLKARVQSTKEKHAKIEQNQESDIEFVKKLAQRNNYEFYVDADGTFQFGPPQDTSRGVVTLRWGEGLLSFKPEANLAAQVTEVEVYGWDPDTKKVIVGKAQAGSDESGKEGGQEAGGTKLKRVSPKGAVLQLRQPVFTEAEARRRAEAILNDHAKRFLTGEAEAIGLTELVPDANVDIDNVGQPFSKTYYIEQATHKVDGGGYRTRLKLKEAVL